MGKQNGRSDGIRTSANADGSTCLPSKFGFIENTLPESHPPRSSLSTELLQTCKSGQIISAYRLP